MSYEYTVRGEVVRLTPDPTTVAIRFHDEAPNSARARATQAVPGMEPFAARREVPRERLTLVPVARPAVGGPSPAAAMGALDAQPEVAKALPVFRVGGNQAVPTERVLIGTVGAVDEAALVARHGLAALRSDDGTILAQAPDETDVFALCRRLAADPEVEFAEPDFVVLSPAGLDAAAGPLNATAKRQYALAITRALEAHQIVTGDPAIRVAVLDDGVDTGHPDLEPAVVATWDAVDEDTYQEPNWWDGHGTACAGLAVAAGGGTGVRGTGAGCSLVAIRIAQKPSPDPKALWSFGVSRLESSIRWAWKEGRADVLSNSWTTLPSNALAKALDQARREGRGGLGCVVVAAAGNEGLPVANYPALLEGVLTVAASNQFDEVKTRTSADGEPWGSCHGPCVSLAAPGVANLTTDVRDGQGKAGYESGAYARAFNGTSAATPLVAGGCALLLSARPGLTEAQVRHLLCSTADRIGQFPYDEQGRNDHAGFGRMNLLRAVEAALAGA